MQIDPYKDIMYNESSPHRTPSRLRVLYEETDNAFVPRYNMIVIY